MKRLICTKLVKPFTADILAISILYTYILYTSIFSRNKINSLFSSNIFKKSLANIDINSLEFTPENLPMLKRLLCNGQNEIIALRRKMKSGRMKQYRYKKRVTDMKSLTSYMKQHKYLTDNVSKLEVSANVNLYK